MRDCEDTPVFAYKLECECHLGRLVASNRRVYNIEIISTVLMAQPHSLQQFAIVIIAGRPRLLVVSGQSALSVSVVYM